MSDALSKNLEDQDNVTLRARIEELQRDLLASKNALKRHKEEAKPKEAALDVIVGAVDRLKNGR